MNSKLFDQQLLPSNSKTAAKIAHVIENILGVVDIGINGIDLHAAEKISDRLQHNLKVASNVGYFFKVREDIISETKQSCDLYKAIINVLKLRKLQNESKRLLFSKKISKEAVS